MGYDYYICKKIVFIIKDIEYELYEYGENEGHDFAMDNEKGEPIMYKCDGYDSDDDKETKIKKFDEYKKKLFKSYEEPDKILYENGKWEKENYCKKYEEKIRKNCEREKLEYSEITKIYKNTYIWDKYKDSSIHFR